MNDVNSVGDQRPGREAAATLNSKLPTATDRRHRSIPIAAVCRRSAEARSVPRRPCCKWCAPPPRRIPILGRRPRWPTLRPDNWPGAVRWAHARSGRRGDSIPRPQTGRPIGMGCRVAQPVSSARQTATANARMAWRPGGSIQDNLMRDLKLPRTVIPCRRPTKRN